MKKYRFIRPHISTTQMYSIKFPKMTTAILSCIFTAAVSPVWAGWLLLMAERASSDVMADVKQMTGSKSIFITHSQGGAVGWDVDVENLSAIIAIEPGGTLVIGSEQYQKLLENKILSRFTSVITSTTVRRISNPRHFGKASEMARLRLQSSTTLTAVIA